MVIGAHPLGTTPVASEPYIAPTHLEAFRRMRRRGAPGDCPMCKKDVAWILLTDGVNRFATLPIVDKDGKSAEISALALSCGNCGFVALHAIDQLVMGEEPKSAGAADG